MIITKKDLKDLQNIVSDWNLKPSRMIMAEEDAILMGLLGHNERYFEYTLSNVPDEQKEEYIIGCLKNHNHRELGALLNVIKDKYPQYVEGFEKLLVLK